MTPLIEASAASFVGQVYTTESVDEAGTFAAAWADFEQAGWFDQLDQQAVTPNRTYLLVFSPYGQFQYWIGSLLGPEAKVPTGLNQLALPPTTVGEVTAPASALLTHLPVQSTYMTGLDRLAKAGFPLPNHIGQTDHPYYLESYQLHAGAVQAVTYRLYINPEQLEGVDDYD